MISRIQVIAEAAQGFEGSPQVALLLVRGAAAARADAVKFQLVYADELATPAYQHYDLFKNLEMPRDAWERVAAEARRLEIGVIFDVFGPSSLRLALDLGAGVKLHAADFSNEELIAEALEGATRLFVSIGGVTVDELEAFLTRHARYGEKITVMFGFQAEPTNAEDNHLARLALLRQRFPETQFGFMDHADGDSDEAGWLGALAIAAGAVVIEKHLTLDRALQMEDYLSALSPEAFSRYVARVRVAEKAMGDASLALTPPEQAYRSRASKVVVARRDLAPGVRVAREGLVLLRAPLETGRIAITRLEDATGRVCERAVAAGQPVYADDVR